MYVCLVRLSLPSTLLALFPPLYPPLRSLISHARTACKLRLFSNRLMYLLCQMCSGCWEKKSLKKSWALPGGIWMTMGQEATVSHLQKTLVNPHPQYCILSHSPHLMKDKVLSWKGTKLYISYKMSLNRLQFLTSVTLEDMRGMDCRKRQDLCASPK